MMRLIDADDFFLEMENSTDLCAEMEIDGLKALKKYLDMQPTAYDVDKVVAELEEEKKQSAADWYFYRRNRNWHMHDVYDGKINAFIDAIKIVKGENHETEED